MPVCQVCCHHCQLKEGQIGFCGGRVCHNGEIVDGNYGKITSLALDPIEKKPLRRFHPGSRILSVGSYGCNLRCPFCQNSSISWSAEAFALAEDVAEEEKPRSGEQFHPEDPCGQGNRGIGKKEAERRKAEDTQREREPEIMKISPEKLTDAADWYRREGNIGVAFTYNEPLIGYEFVRDTARLVHERGMVNVLVSNGTANLSVLEEIAPYIDAMNIDLKSFTDHFYSDVLQGNRQMVMDFIRKAVKICHVELTTLIIPGENDSVEEMEEISSWIADLTDVYDGVSGRDIPLHISRFFPQFHMTDRGPTDVGLIYRLADTARQKLHYVYTGNC